MFVQVIQGKTNDAAAFRKQAETWESEVGDGAKGFLGTTGGIAEDGTVLLMARFESEDAARANSDRPEQSAWWAETSKFFDGEPTFRNCNDVQITGAGGSDSAGFVQVMQGRALNRKRLDELDSQFEAQMGATRTDVIGSVRAWDGDHFTDAIYFTSEAEARAGEAKMAEGEVAALMGEFTSLIEGLTFIDLKDPILRSAP